ncbi:MAG: HAMP domain-containing protein [Oscillospiraceae bacterium]|jgi:signal transduction histidine kinase|nr:HAMP domain-containing protein [Oscillospiraceae bacterium]
MRSLRTQLSFTIGLVALGTVALISFVSNSLIRAQFEAYVARRQQTRAEDIAENVGQYYDGSGAGWDLASIHALSMLSLYDGYIIRLEDGRDGVIWDTENHDMGMCRQIMGEISDRMSGHGRVGEFASQTYDVTQDGQKIGAVTVKYYGPFFLSDADFSFLAAMNIIFTAIGALALIFSLATGWFSARRIADPLRKTADIARRIAQGRYDVRFESRTRTRELRELVSAINHLAEALSGQERLRRQLTADVAHELRTPLTTLGSHIEAMIEGLWTPSPERLKSCYDEILRLGNMVADLERLERAESEALKLNKSRVELKSLTKAVCDNFAGQLAAGGLRLEISGSEAEADADRDRISGVITNLVSNAVKYTPADGQINIFIRELPDAAAFIIEDDGIGIPEDELSLVFERFYRTDKSRNRGTGGAGLGLSIVKSVVEAHGGTVMAENRPGGGSRFTVTLPRGDKTAGVYGESTRDS